MRGRCRRSFVGRDIGFFWYQADGTEPAHVHVWNDGKECTIWLGDLSVAFNHGHSPRDMQALIGVTATEQARLLEVWNEQFGR